MAASNLSPYWLSQSTRQILAALRVLPSLIWALIFVIVVGVGPLAGVLAMTMYTVGYLGKLQYEALEGVSKEPWKSPVQWDCRVGKWLDFLRYQKQVML